MARPDYIYMIYIQAPCEKVWDALIETTPDCISRAWPAIISRHNSLLETDTALAIPTTNRVLRMECAVFKKS